MLHYEDGYAKVIADATDCPYEFFLFLGIHSCCRFIQQKDFWLGGHGPGDFQQPLVAVRQAGGQLIL